MPLQSQQGFQAPVSPRRIVVGLSVPVPGAFDRWLFDWLASVFSVRFELWTENQPEPMDAILVLGTSPVENRAVASLGLPSLKMAAEAEGPEAKTISQVQFANAATVPGFFRGRLLEQEELGVVEALKPENSDTVLATISGQPVWTVRHEDGCRADFVGLSLPKFDEARSLFHYFEGFNFFRLLPLIDFLRRLTGEDQWSCPQIHACFMFDDPNLHGSGYGWLDYRKLAAHASAHRYHVAMATVPLDSWFISSKAAGIFGENKDRLSLLVHGNDHLQHELAGFGSEEQALQRLAQALRRVAKMEREYSIQMPRVMAAPHGACSEDSLQAMARLGFESVALAPGAFYASNRPKAWAKHIGFKAADVILGMPCLGRFRFKYGNRFALLAAYLNQPIIPYGHHEDVAGGLGVLEDLAHFINSLGEVCWTNMGGVSRSSYLVRREGALLRVNSYARILHVPVPEGVTEAAIERPWVDGGAGRLRIQIGGRTDGAFLAGAGETFPVKPGEVIEASFLHPEAVDPCSVVDPGLSLKAMVRRQLCELRDRTAPLVSMKNVKYKKHHLKTTSFPKS